MNNVLPSVNCPVCDAPISLDNRHWVIKCNCCKNEIQVVVHNGKVLSIQRFLSLGHPENYDEIFLGYVKNNLPLEKWGFDNSPHLFDGYIFESKFCRVKFELSLFNYYPLFETIIYYGRLHAPDNEKHLMWNGKKCLCWHSNIYITIPFIEGISAQQLAADSHRKIWQSFVDNLKVDYPPTFYLEYPLQLHAKIWEHYGERFFSIFDLRKPELWEKYSEYSDIYNESVKKRLDLSRDIEKIC